MTRVGQRILVFRLSGIGFVLDLDKVVEVRGGAGDSIDWSRSDPEQAIVAALPFRGTMIPVVEPRRLLGLSPLVQTKDKSAVILKGGEGNWAILVDQIEDLSLSENFASCQLPLLLQGAVDGRYSQLKLLNGEPFVVFDPDCFYGSQAVVL